MIDGFIWNWCTPNRLSNYHQFQVTWSYLVIRLSENGVVTLPPKFQVGWSDDHAKVPMNIKTTLGLDRMWTKSRLTPNPKDSKDPYVWKFGARGFIMRRWCAWIQRGNIKQESRRFRASDLGIFCKVSVWTQSLNIDLEPKWAWQMSRCWLVSTIPNTKGIVVFDV